MYNKIIIVGRAGKDSETKQTGTGKVVCEFSLAVDDNKKINGEWVNNTIWLKVSCFGLQAEKLQVSKGEIVLVDGKITEQKYKNKEGAEITKISVIADNVKKLIKTEAKEKENQAKLDDDDLPF